MPYIPPEVVKKAREMDLLTYLKNYEPQELFVSAAKSIALMSTTA